MPQDSSFRALPADLRYIDAHQHFWDLRRNSYPWLQSRTPPPFRYGDTSALRRDYLPADYLRDAGVPRPIASVHVEAEWAPHDPVAETAWLSQLATDSGWPSACVAHVALHGPDCAQQLAAHAAFSLVRGIRHKPAAAARPNEARRGEPGSMDDAAWREGYALLGRYGWSFDLQTPWWHLDAAAELARDFPDTPLILNHTGLPAQRDAAGLAGWRAALQGLAREPNTSIKLSGLGLADGSWDAAQNVELMREAIAIFGPRRCLFASNFPVDGLVTSFGDILRAFLAAIAHFDPAEQADLLCHNARRIYRLSVVVSE